MIIYDIQSKVTKIDVFLVTIVIKFREGVEVAKYTQTDRKPYMEKNVMRSEMDKNPETHGMQDINYTFYHCMEITATVEVRRCKYPTLQSHWEEVELLAWSPRLLCLVLLLPT